MWLTGFVERSEVRVTLFLPDNSVLARVGHNGAVREALLRIAVAGPLATCLPQRLEFGVSARSVAEYEANMSLLDEWVPLAISLESERRASDLQEGLVEQGIHRSAAVMGTIIAAVALTHGARVIHYDSDLDTIRRVAPELSASWIVEKGSVS